MIYTECSKYTNQMDKIKRDQLFKYFAEEHDINLLDSDFNEIENILQTSH